LKKIFSDESNNKRVMARTRSDPQIGRDGGTTTAPVRTTTHEARKAPAVYSQTRLALLLIAGIRREFE
jgi:hypothetical protein